MSNVPYIPDNAPFTPQQRAWLNGFFAGLFANGQPAAAEPAAPLSPVTIVFGSQTGNAEALAKKAAAEAKRLGFEPRILDMSQCSPETLQEAGKLLLITSTYGDGDPPDNAKPLWEKLKNGESRPLDGVQYSLLALGDSNYPKFCEFGKIFDNRLAELGAKRVHPRVDCDVDFDEAFQAWLGGALGAFGNGAHVSAPAAATAPEKPAYSRSHPFSAKLLVNRQLNSAGTIKDTRHLEISLEGSGMTYEAGDALGVAPSNCPELVDAVMNKLGSKDEALRNALLNEREINRIPTALLEAAGLAPEYGQGRDLLDFVSEHPEVRFDVAKLRKLQPRLYSIASSLKAHPGEVHLTVAVVRYESQGRARKGVCSTFLGERVKTGDKLPVFVHTNKAFRPPADGSRPMIMVGPGTGIAPFRAFLEERKAAGAKGKNWLFFGDQHAKTDFLYQDELEAMQKEGTLARLDTAWSRDQAHKIYVQDRIRESGVELFKWLEEGAHFYVCGDAKRMAGDVDRALREVIQKIGSRSPEQAVEYLKKMQDEKRYQRDVY